MSTNIPGDFRDCTGKGVKIAVIDSGIDISHPDIHGVCGGIGFNIGKDNEVQAISDYHDTVGHGTACAGIILSKVPDVELYAVKIFHDELLEAKPEALAAAIIWAVDNGMKIVNMSLGVSNTCYVDILKEVCDYAEAKNCILISADSNNLEIVYPASFRNVIAVTGGRIKNPEAYFFLKDSPVEFIAKGNTQRIAWLNREYAFLERNSFASPHIAGLAAKILERHPCATFEQVKQILIESASHGYIELTTETKRPFYLLQKQLSHNNKSEPHYSWMKKVCIYPFNKEMHALVRARDLLNFSIDSIVDVVGKGMVGKDAGEAIGIENAGIKVEHNLDKALEKADTLILGHVNELSEIRNKDILLEILEKACQMGKNVYHLDPAPDTESYRYLKTLAAEKNIHIDTHMVEDIDVFLQEMSLNIKNDVPVIGVFGTSAQQGKFTTQLALRRMFLMEGYEVAQIGTEPHSELFGFDMSFPIGYNSCIDWPERYYIPYLHYKMLKIAYQKKPDIFIVGAQSNIVPYDISESTTVNLSSIAFLLATKPDAYILTVNSMDSDEYISASIAGMESLGQGKTICLTMSDKEKEVKTVYGITSIQYRQLDKSELKAKMRRMEDKFDIPVTDVVSPEGQQRLFDTVIKHFTHTDSK